MKFFGLLICLIFSIVVMAQTSEVVPSCGTTFNENAVKESVQMAKERSLFTQKFIKNQRGAKARNSNNLVPIQIHIIRRSNGTGGIDLTIVNSAITQLNSYYSNANLEFFQCAAINYIDNDTYYDFERADSDDDMIGFLKENAINLFFTGTVNSFGLHVGGYASIPNQYQRFVMLENGFISGTTLVEHEMGHIFGLAHTHGQWGHSLTDCPTNPTTHPLQVWCQGAVKYYNSNTDDNNDGINDCEQTGDEVCDTPADPNLNGNVTGCTYTGTGTDYFGDTFDPLMNNIMSYGPNNCINSFTLGQYARIRFWYENYLAYTACHDCNGANSIKTVTNTNDAGIGSLRWAIECGYAQSQQITIEFDIPGAGDKVINLLSELYLNNGIIIDGTTQPSGKIILDYSQATDPNTRGIFIVEDNSEIYGLTIQHTPSHGVLVRGKNVKVGALGKGNTIQNCGVGIFVFETTDVQIIDNTINHNSNSSILIRNSPSNCLVSQNSTFCNEYSITLQEGSNNNITPPSIFIADDNGFSGNSANNAIIELFVGDDCSGNSSCEGKTYLGTTVANSLGNWTLSFPLVDAINNGDLVIATQRIGNNSSAYSDCTTYTGSDYMPPSGCESDEITAQIRNLPIPDTLSAVNTITSTDIIEEMADVTYLAGQSITLNTNFYAKANSNFLAKIMDNCSSNFSNENSETSLNQEAIPSISLNTLDLNPSDLVVFPNPFNNQTNIQFTLNNPSPIQLSLYNLNGQKIKTLLPFAYYEIGTHQLYWDRESLSSGLYLLHLNSKEGRLVKKVMLMR